MNRIEIQKKVSDELSKLKTKKGVYSFISQAEDYQIVNQEIIRFLTKNMGYAGIYVTLIKAHCDIEKELKNQKINTAKLFYIDNKEDETKCKARNCIYLDKNQSLTALSLAMSKAVKQESMQFLFFDSMTTLLIYNKLNAAGRFIQYVINKIKNLNILMIVISVNEEKTEKILPILSQFCDGTINI